MVFDTSVVPNVLYQKIVSLHFDRACQCTAVYTLGFCPHTVLASQHDFLYFISQLYLNTKKAYRCSP